MNTAANPSPLPPSVLQKLKAVHRRDLALRLGNGLMRCSAVLLGAMLLAMILDWLCGWFDPRWRTLMTAGAVGLGVAAWVIWFLGPLLQRRTLVATAQEVDRLIPALEERWSTVTELSQNTDHASVRGSEMMIQKVISEAESASDRIIPRQLIPARQLHHARRWLLGVTALFAVLLLVNFSQTRLLLERFWYPTKNISLTQVRALQGDQVVALAEPLTLSVTTAGRIKADAAIFLRGSNLPARRVELVSKTGSPGAFEYPVKEVKGSFEYRVRSGDGQTPWHSVTAVTRPQITEVKLRIVPPAYSRLAEEAKASLPQQLRVLQGSELQVSFRADQPLTQLTLRSPEGGVAGVVSSTNGWFHCTLRPTNTVAFTAVLKNQFQLENKVKPGCRITVYEDQPPAVTILEPSDSIAAQPDEKITIAFEAADDFGIDRADLIVATSRAGEEPEEKIISVPLSNEQGNKQLQKEVELDLASFNLKPGDQISYKVQVADTKGSAFSAAEQAKPKSVAAAALEEAELAQLGKPSADAEESAAADSTSARQEESKPAGESKNALARSNHSSSNPSMDSQESKPNGQSPPENEMSKRNLDVAGQSSACSPRNITIEEWKGTFDGEKRQKDELAIDAILKQLDHLLAQAQTSVETLRGPAMTVDLVSPTNAAAVITARKALTDSDHAIAELNSRSRGTPYAFIGLQLQNIVSTHVAPAREILGALPAEVATAQKGRLDQSAFHIRRAREMLADLTKTYETAKREQERADDLQKLATMYQIFLEDSQALLGSKPGALNSFDRRIAEVDEAFVEQLKKLLEEKKDIMAALAKLLADDPRLLRRYMAMLDAHATSYRDQMTLLARRQSELNDQVHSWNGTPAPEQAGFLKEFSASYGKEQAQVASDISKLHQNLETWLPLDIKPEHPRIQAVRAQTQRIHQHAAADPSANIPADLRVSTGTATSAHAALEGLRKLHEDVGDLGTVNPDNGKLLVYVANRLDEVERLITAQSAVLKVTDALAQKDFPKAAEVLQHRLAQDTTTLSEKLSTVSAQVSGMSPDIGQAAKELTDIVRDDIIARQTAVVTELEAGRVKPAEEMQKKIDESFSHAEATFDRLMKLMIAKMDEAPPPTEPGGNKSLDDLLAMIQDEMKAAESLGIPCRPLNVSVLKDWMQPGSKSGQGQAQAQAAAAQGQAGQDKARAVQDQARKEARARQARNSPAKPVVPGPKMETASSRKPEAAWNTLASKLGKDVLQGRDNNPPEQYQRAIDNYFKIITEKVPASPE